MMTASGPHTAMDHSSDDTWTDAGFRLSWPGRDTAGQPDRRGCAAGGKLAALLCRAIPTRRDCCTGWPVTLSAPAQR